MDTICCLCLTETEATLQDITSNNLHNERVDKIFGVQLLADSDYPTAACRECLTTLESCWNFRQQVLNSFACLNILGSADDHQTPALKQEAPELLEELSNQLQATSEVLEDAEMASEDATNRPEESMLEESLDESSIFVDDTEILRHEEELESDGKHNCRLCRKTFPTATRLKVHELSHSQDRPFGCTECPIRFKTERNAKNHYLTLHATERPLVCEKCSKTFARAADLKKHMKSIHAEKQCRCSVCGRCFVSAEKLEQHHQQHRIKTLFECNVCSVCFRTPAKLNEHMDTHTNAGQDDQVDTLNATNRCAICKKCFISRSALYSHAVTHSEERPYQCPHCELTFKVRSTMLAHEKVVHMKVLPHQCPICQKGHSRKSNLAKHMKTHSKYATGSSGSVNDAIVEEEELVPEPTDEWRCQHCDKSFGSQQKLRTHTRTHHSGKQNYCKLCHELFPNRNEFEDHHVKVHGLKKE